MRLPILAGIGTYAGRSPLTDRNFMRGMLTARLVWRIYDTGFHETLTDQQQLAAVVAGEGGRDAIAPYPADNMTACRLHRVDRRRI